MASFPKYNYDTASHRAYQQRPSHIALADGSVYPSSTLPPTLYQNQTHGSVMDFWPGALTGALGHDMRAQSAPIGNSAMYQYEHRRDGSNQTAMLKNSMEAFQPSVHQLHTPPMGPHSFTPVAGHISVQPSQERSKYTFQKYNLSRFESTLCSQTAMFHKEEVPSTYLNKGQTYMLKIADKTPLVSGSMPVKYVTSIRISFEDDELRGKAADCWRLWKRTRGRNSNGECSESNKKQWLAVELVDAGTDPIYASPISPELASGHSNFSHPACAQLVKAQFDGLTVVWSPTQSSAQQVPQECLIPIRFNFLSTDFMPSKGVKGAPMRLCVKTKVIQSGAPSQVSAAQSDNHEGFNSPAISVASPVISTPTPKQSPSLVNPLDETTNESWYCKIQAFRDHGAERKFQNHRQQIESAIANNSAKLANLLNGIKDGSHSPRGSLGSSPSSDSGAVRGNAGVTKVNRRRKCTGSTDLITRVQSKIDALRFALESAEDCIMLTMTSWHPDDDPDALRPDILNDGHPGVEPIQPRASNEIAASTTQPIDCGHIPSSSLLGVQQVGPVVSPLSVRPHSADEAIHGYPVFMSSPGFTAAATTVSPYSETQELALGYGVTTAHASPIYLSEDLMYLPSKAPAEHECLSQEHLIPFSSDLPYGELQNQLHEFSNFSSGSLDFVNNFTLHDPLKQDWNDFGDSGPVNHTGEVF